MTGFFGDFDTLTGDIFGNPFDKGKVMTTLTDLAAAIATKAHKGQTRWGGQPYITHPARVARKLIEDNWSQDYVAVAWLHDTIEDTYHTPETLLEEGVPEHIVDSVVVMTKTADISYLDYILSVSGDSIARVVKMYDIMDNMNDWPKHKKKGSMYQKYELALYILDE